MNKRPTNEWYYIVGRFLVIAFIYACGNDNSIMARIARDISKQTLFEILIILFLSFIYKFILLVFVDQQFFYSGISFMLLKIFHELIITIMSVGHYRCIVTHNHYSGRWMNCLGSFVIFNLLFSSFSLCRSSSISHSLKKCP